MIDALEFRARAQYLRHNYTVWSSLLSTPSVINKDIARLKRAASAPAPEAEPAETPLHPLVALAIHLRARELRSDDDDRPVNHADSFAACLEVARVARPLRGRPPASVLIYHVHGFMALWADAFGKMIGVSRLKDSVYEPRWLDTGGKTLETFFRGIDPAITRTQLVNIVRKAHSSKEIAGKQFLDCFPLYGASLDPETLTLTPAPGRRVEQFQLLRPLYCP